MDDIYGEFWANFLEKSELPETTVLNGYTYFGGSEEESVQALEQLRAGEKTVISHCIPAYIATKKRMPRIGDYTMVTDFYGNPGCILHTTDVALLPMGEVPEELLLRECREASREEWLAARQTEYAALANQVGFHYNEEIPVLMETVTTVFS